MGNSSAKSVPERIRLLLVKVELGPFSEKQVREYLSNGFLLPSDRAKYDGLEDWVSVDEVLAKLPPIEEISPPVPDPTFLDPIVGSVVENPFSWMPPEVLFKPVFEHARPLIGSVSGMSYSWTPAEILFKPLFICAAPLAGSAFETSYAWKPPKVLFKPLLVDAAPLTGAASETSYTWQSPEVLYRPLFIDAAPLVESVSETPYAWKPPKVLFKPLLVNAAPLIGSASGTSYTWKPSEVLFKPLFGHAVPLARSVFDVPYSWKPPEVLFRPAFVEAAPLLGSVLEIPYVWKPPEILFKPLESIPPNVSETVQSVPANSPLGQSSVAAVSAEKLVPITAEVAVDPPASSNAEKDFARSVRGVFRPSGGREIPPSTRLLMARTQADSRSKRSFFNKIQFRLKNRMTIYSISGIVLGTIFCAGYFWPVLQPLVENYWIAMNLALYGFFDEVVRILTST